MSRWTYLKSQQLYPTLESDWTGSMDWKDCLPALVFWLVDKSCGSGLRAETGTNREACISRLHRLWGLGFRLVVRSCEETGALCLQAGAIFLRGPGSWAGWLRTLAGSVQQLLLAPCLAAPSPCLYSPGAPFTGLLWCPWLIHFPFLTVSNLLDWQECLF